MQRARGEVRSISDRKYRINFIGTYYNFFDRNMFFNGLPNEIANIISDIIDLVMDSPLTPIMTALRQVIKARGMSVSDQWIRVFCFKYLDIANLYIRAWCKREIVRTLIDAELPIDIWGGTMGNPKDGWRAGKNTVFHGRCSYRESLQIISDSKMTVNAGVFPGGVHDRVTTAMLNGSISITDPSTYYNRIFVDGEDSLSFDWKHLDELPEKVLKLLDDEDKMQEMADLGRKKAFENHTWTHRAKKIIEQVEIYKAVAGIS